jgi:hypothetical protein
LTFPTLHVDINWQFGDPPNHQPNYQTFLVNVVFEWLLRYSQVLKKYWTNLAWELYNTVLIKYNDWMMKGIEAQFIAPQWLDVQKKLNIDIINDKRLYLNNTKCNKFRTGNKYVQTNWFHNIEWLIYLAVFQLSKIIQLTSYVT